MIFFNINVSGLTFRQMCFSTCKDIRKKRLHGEKTPRTNFAPYGSREELWWGVTRFCCRTVLFRMCCFLSSRHCFYFFPDMDRKNLCCACSAWSGFSVARTFFRPRFITHRPDLCQIGGMSSPDKKDSFRVIYFKNRALKDSKKRVNPAPSSLL